jgi:hypothetical protein
VYLYKCIFLTEYKLELPLKEIILRSWICVADPGSGAGIWYGEKIGFWIWEEQPGSYFQELWVKILEFFDADPGWKIIRNRDPGWKKFGSGIRSPARGKQSWILLLTHLDGGRVNRVLSLKV